METTKKITSNLSVISQFFNLTALYNVGSENKSKLLDDKIQELADCYRDMANKVKNELRGKGRHTHIADMHLSLGYSCYLMFSTKVQCNLFSTAL